MEKTKILLVDDELDFLEVMGARIKGWGYDLVKCPNGEKAVDALMRKKIDIVILDYMMPKMDGVSTLKQIRKINKKIPVIMFTAYPNEKVIKGTEKLGIAAFIPKLSTYSDVQASLKAAINIVEKKLDKSK